MLDMDVLFALEGEFMRSKLLLVMNRSFTVAALLYVAMFLFSPRLEGQDNIAVARSPKLVVQASEVCFSELILCPALVESGGSNPSNGDAPLNAVGSQTSAQDGSNAGSHSSNASNNDSFVNGPHDWVHTWLHNVDKARDTQPHYVAPLVTTHVDLVEQFRWDSSWQTNANGTTTANYGNGHGLEIIPTTFLEVQVAPPPYLSHSGMTPDGFGDLSMFFKYKIAAATEGEGDYFIGAFMGLDIPTGTVPNGMGHPILSPMFAFAKGWPGFVSVQNNFAGNLPTSGQNVLGQQFVWNTTLQAYGIKKYIWPEVEQNSTFFYGGSLNGKKETYITPGIILGYFQIAERLHVGIGGGIQIAATHFHTYNHRWIWSMRFPF
jgi:hypothetical protein